ncbi:wsv435 [White spot syndrome virus]|uniref:Wsv435 n=4 Tax=White spot syndrome virus TaxID=342409 RepID=Q8VAH9_WSSVS|nr:wsv435 [Shrimp white spot syndrome virus]AFX59812.1 wsv435 [White spot syndrome virus]AAL33437.1 wsv435 [Shrimp white spot syndrome virus]AAL89362.1 WSSV494 [Shrimp white spot syndrome virus]AWQ60558.1 wsv435 [Shrimp white spot syndrome virus]AWQ61000.1 wsv435 [Shrimp white spot syndrome virus]
MKTRTFLLQNEPTWTRPRQKYRTSFPLYTDWTLKGSFSLKATLFINENQHSIINSGGQKL